MKKRRFLSCILLSLLAAAFSAQRFTASAAETDLYRSLDGFALREPDNPPPPGGPFVYSQTSSDPHWFVSQWKIAGSKLSPFVESHAGNATIYRATTDAAHVTITHAAGDSVVELGQDGSIVPCLTEAGRPREADLFLTAGHQNGITPGSRDGRPLTSLSGLREIATVSFAAEAAPAPKGCDVSKGAVIVAIILRNFAVQPAQTFFYQLLLGDFCLRNGRGRPCDRPVTRMQNYTAKNPFGANDRLTFFDRPLTINAAPRTIDIDILGRLKEAVDNGPAAMDRDVAHWSLTGGYLGLISFGDVRLGSTWSGYRLVAEN